MPGTRLDTDNTKPSVTQPGDGPADTTDPAERASTVLPRPGAVALATGTVNSVLPIPTHKEPARRSATRTEQFEAIRPDGSRVTVTRDLDTGESQIKQPSTDTGSHRTT